jgi:hypothetical protein
MQLETKQTLCFVNTMEIVLLLLPAESRNGGVMQKYLNFTLT